MAILPTAIYRFNEILIEISMIFLAYVCVHMCRNTYMWIYTCVHVVGQGSRWASSLITVHGIYWGIVSHVNPELTDLASLASQFAPGIPFLPPEHWEYVDPTPWHWHGHWGSELWSYACPWITSTLMPSPQLCGHVTKSSLQSQCSSHKDSDDFLHRTRPGNPNTLMQTQKTAKTTISKRSAAGGSTKPDFKPYYRALVTMASTGTKTDQQTVERNRGPKYNICSCSLWFLANVTDDACQRKQDAGKLGIYMQRIKLWNW